MDHMEVAAPKRGYYAGRPRIKVYQYTADGKYLQTYETQSEVFDKYYDGKTGDLFHNGNIRELPDGTVISKYRPGRQAIRDFIRISNSKYCYNGIRHKPIEAYNLKGEMIASFRSVYHATLLTGINNTTILAHLNRPKSRKHAEIHFKYK